MIARRSLLRALPRTRGYANTASEMMKTDWVAKQGDLQSHAAGRFPNHDQPCEEILHIVSRRDLKLVA